MNMEIEAMSSPRICQESPSPPSIIDKIYHIADHGRYRLFELSIIGLPSSWVLSSQLSLLRLVTNGMRPVGFHVQSGVGEVHGLLLEMALTFGVVYTVYATALDPKRGSLGIIAPLAIGFIVGANILVGGPFDGASMNPARAFGLL
ncbi:hypothetical protein NC653_038789 [Populus alba x Populus x berolinensis]|uniref:Uncharacterized protein n=1 Tax=Populus alba x Populus x berolinensis TaxID=444605 RepID=A0AAD6LJ48_9ROSI|nr:hypothetical protein NC653_038789 [Populus alba x Populus x berolinensis]